MTKKDFLTKTFKIIKTKIDDIKIANLSTIDGFPICCCDFDSEDKVDEEKLSAVASSITALSVATASQLIGSTFCSSTIETDDGTMLLIRTEFISQECILCLITRDEQNIGKARYFALKLAKIIETAKLSAD